jgi:uncharacterized protein YqeY
MTRARLAGDLKSAIKDRDAARVATLRLILAAVKDRDIATRTEESSDGVSDADILSILAKMIKQRQESARIYDEAGRLDLAEQERSEICIIKEYLPKQLSDREVQKAIASAIKDTGASSIRDMGRVMAHLKANHTGQMDFSLAGAVVKDAFR